MGEEPDDTTSGLSFAVATTLDEVLEAWQLVYRAYLRIGLIDAHEFGIHTNPHAVSPNATVVVGRIRGETVSTMTGIHDSEAGLPLDAVYREELDRLRQAGRRLTEVGLFADRRVEFRRMLGALLGLMRLAFYWGYGEGWSDIVIGVHPHHARFYEQLIGFETLGAVRSYSVVNDRPVVLLGLNPAERAKTQPLPRGLASFLRHPPPPGTFDHRFRFDAVSLARSPLAGYLAYRADRTTHLDRA
jgi:hypothetical protein